MSDKWTTNDNDFTNDLVTIKVNGVAWDVADTYARSQLLTKLTAPTTAGTSGQVLTVTDSGIAWQTHEGGGAGYTEGEGISISNSIISVDWSTVAQKEDIVNYTAGSGISISDGVISCTVTPEGGAEYTAGDGLLLIGNEFEVDFETVAKKSDIGTGGTSDYNALENKPLIAAGEGVTVEIIKGGTLIVSGAGDETTNGNYEMVDQTAVGTARVWQKESRKLYHDGTKWLFDDDTDASSFYYSSESATDPWDATFAASLELLGAAPTVAMVENGMQDKIIIDIGDTIGDINTILDDINGEVL